MILSILDIKKTKRFFLLYSIFLIIFAFIYELFSHQVYSYYMIFSFLIPLIFGYFISFFKKEGCNELCNSIYNMGVITLSIYSVYMGVLEIYGSTNKLVDVYLYVGILLMLIGLITSFKKK